MTASSSLPFHESPHRYFVMRNLYESAVKQLVLKLEILNSEFNTLYARNPIHHIESRVKSSESIAAKLQRKGSPVTLEAAARDINDIAGVRVVCNYIDDVYRVAGMLERQEDLEIVKRQDYIKTPNYNGYRSLHLDVRVPVYLSDRTEHVVAEIQIRTIAMTILSSSRAPFGLRSCAQSSSSSSRSAAAPSRSRASGLPGMAETASSSARKTGSAA